MKIQIKLLDSQATIPRIGTEHAAGLDLFCGETMTLKPKETKLISTNISIGIPNTMYAKTENRSSIVMNKQLMVLSGIIDADYTGEVKVMMHNFGQEDQCIKRGEKFCQLIIQKFEKPNKIQVVDTLPQTKRGNKGFGSTGT